MNPTAGWYQDVERPPGHLRYWDGLRWTEHRVPPPPGTFAPPPAAATHRSGWVRSHKVLTAVLVVLALALVGSWLPSYDDAGTESASSTVEEPDAGTGPKDGVRSRARDSSEKRSTEKATATGRDRDGGKRGGRVTAAPKRRAAPRPAPPTFYVSRIVDGDTIELGNGETVRLVGIDTPEVGECGFEEASANLSSLILGEMVRLGESDEDRDSYGRLLRYVDLGDMDAGLRLIKNGRAIAAYDSRDGYGFHPRETTYIASDRGSTNLCRMQTGQQAPPTRAAAPQPKPKPQPLMGGNGNAGGNCASGYSPCLPDGRRPRLRRRERPRAGHRLRPLRARRRWRRGRLRLLTRAATLRAIPTPDVGPPEDARTIASQARSARAVPGGSSRAGRPLQYAADATGRREPWSAAGGSG